MYAVVTVVRILHQVDHIKPRKTWMKSEAEHMTIKDRQGYLQDIAVQTLHFPLDRIDQNERLTKTCLSK